MAVDETLPLIALTAEIVANYTTGNQLDPSELPGLIQSVHQALASAGEPQVAPEPDTKVTPAQIRKSITSDALISFVDGKPYKSLKRHLSSNGLTPNEYRGKFGLPRDYPMVAPSYSERRSALARSAGLGQRRQPEPPPPAAAAASPASAPKRARSRKQAEQQPQAANPRPAAAIDPTQDEFT